MSEEMKNEEVVPVVTEEAKVEDKVEDTVVVDEAPVAEPVVEEPVVETKPEEKPENVIGAPRFEGSSPETVQAVGVTTGGAIGTVVTPKPVKKAPAKKAAAKKEETVAIYSTRNVTWAEVGKVYRGYNVVTKAAADKWLTRDHVRLATPEEVAKEYGK